MYIKKLVLSVLVLFILNGCSFSKQESITVKESVEGLSVKPNLPEWILHPDKEKHICCIGSASITDMRTTKTIAFIIAKANISKQTEVYVDALVDENTECKEDGCYSSLSSTLSEQSANILRDVEIVDSYEDSTNNIYYLRACIKITKEKNI